MFRALVLFLFSFMFLACSGTNSENKDQNTSNNTQKETSPMTELKKDTLTVAVIQTNMGTIEIELFADKAVKTVQNFVGLGRKKIL